MSLRSDIALINLLKVLELTTSKYYSWKRRIGIENQHNGQQPKAHWLTPEEQKAVIDFARKHINKNDYSLKDGYRRIAYMGIDAGAFACSPASVNRILRRAGLLQRWNKRKPSSKGNGFNQPNAPHQHWHTDIKYINFKGTFLYFISVLDGYSRYILHHELRTNMTERDVEIVIQRAIEKFPNQKNTRIISDNGSQYISKDFKEYIKNAGLTHIRTSVSYPQSNGKIERVHSSLQEECVSNKSFIHLKDAREQISNYVDHYNHKRLHSSLFYLRPVDFLTGNIDELIKDRQSKLDEAIEKRKKYWKNNLKITEKITNLN